MTDKKAKLNLTLEDAQTLGQVREWLAVADAEGFTDACPVNASVGDLTVSRWAQQA